MKKLYRILLLILVLVILLSGCGKKKEQPEPVEPSEPDIYDSLADLARQKGEELGINSLLSLANVSLQSQKGDISIMARSLQSILDNGAITNTDVSVKLEPGKSSGELKVDLEGISVFLRVTNTTSELEEIRNCLITHCEICSDDITVAERFAVGSTTQEQLRAYFGTPYREWEGNLVYRVSFFSLSDLSDIHAAISAAFDTGSLRQELHFVFESNNLVKISLDIPFFLYQGLQDNVPRESLENLTEEETEAAVDLRDTILDALLKAFKEEGVSAVISEETGEVVLDQTILFGSEESHLTEEGKSYLEKVSRAYSSVIMGEYEGKIDEIVFEGHTNTLGTYEYNLDLSIQRAENVMDYFISNDANGLSENQKAQLTMLSSAKGFSYTDQLS